MQMCFWNISPISLLSSQLKSETISKCQVFLTRHLQPHCSFPSHIQCRNQKPESYLPIFVAFRLDFIAPENISNYYDEYEQQTCHLLDTVGIWLVHARWPTSLS